MDDPIIPVPSERLPPAHYGLKACNIARLAQLAAGHGFAVPPGFILPPRLLESLWPSLGLDSSEADHTYAAIIDRCDVELAHAIKQRIALVDFPQPLVESLDQAWGELMARAGETPLVVRSSFHAEDQVGLSCAGIFESVADVRGIPMLQRALRTVYGSLFSERTVRYLNAARVAVAPRMSVIVQQMLGGPGWCGGVAHSAAPDLETRDLLLIAATPDLHGVTSGVSCPEEYLVHRPNLTGGRHCIVHRTAGTATNGNGFCFDETSIVPLARAVLDLEQVFGQALEVEWARAPDGLLYVLQARPIPRPAHPEKAVFNTAGARPIVTGLAVGHGHFTGVVRRTDSIEEAAHCGPEHVLVTRLTNPDWETAMLAVGAIVTESGGRTSHAARLARERHKLAVVAVGEPVNRLRTGDRVTVVCNDGLEGAIFPAQELERSDQAPVPVPATLRVTNPFGAFSLARANNPVLVEVEIDHVLRAIRIPPEALSASFSLTPQLAARIAGYRNARHFVRARLRDAVAIVCAAFPAARVRVCRATSTREEAFSFGEVLDEAVAELVQRFGFQVESLPLT